MAAPLTGGSVYDILSNPTPSHPVLTRRALEQYLATPDFGSRLCGEKLCCVQLWARSHRADFFDRIAEVARECTTKQADLVSTKWKVEANAWLDHPIDLRPLSERMEFQCRPDIYAYGAEEVPAGSLVVDFANARVGGGCFTRGFVQEEQMVLQSTDLAMRLAHSRETLGEREAVSIEGVHMDAWWPRPEAEKREASFDLAAIERCHSHPLTILAVDAPMMNSRSGGYNRWKLRMLAMKTFLVFHVARELKSPLVLSGLLGGGAFRGNRPLVLLLHMLLHRPEDPFRLNFHHPVFQSFKTGRSTSEVEMRILRKADDMIVRLQQKGVKTLEDAVRELQHWNLPTSQDDNDVWAPTDSAAYSSS